MSRTKPFSMLPYVLLLLVTGATAFVLEVWCFPNAARNLTTNVILLITAVVFLLQWREAFETRRLLLVQSFERDRPKLSFQLTPEMRSDDTAFSVINKGTRDVEARVTLRLTWVLNDKPVEASGIGLNGGEDSWIVPFGETRSGHFRLVELSHEPRGAEQKDIVSLLMGRRGIQLSLSVEMKARNLESASDDWVRFTTYNWILRPDERTWIADHKLRE